MASSIDREPGNWDRKCSRTIISPRSAMNSSTCRVKRKKKKKKNNAIVKRTRNFFEARRSQRLDLLLFAARETDDEQRGRRGLQFTRTRQPVTVVKPRSVTERTKRGEESETHRETNTLRELRCFNARRDKT